MIKLFITSGLFFITISLFAQEPPSKKKVKKEERKERIDALVKQEEEGVITYKKHFIFAGKLSSDGYGVFFEVGRGKSITKSLLFQLEISERKHPKEEKQSNVFLPTSPIIYGKQNFIYPIKLGVQQQFLLGNKSNKNGISITGNIGGGVCMALLRPYMIEVDTGGQAPFFVNSSDTALFLDKSIILGGPNFNTGWKNLKATPGIYIKPAIRFDYGRYNEVVSALEVGLTGEFYAKKISQMFFSKEQQFFFSAYVAIMFGKRK